MGSTTNGDGWALEVVRGKDPGRVFALGPGEVLLGNAPGEGSGIDLAGQEPDASPRRMANRHAAMECSPRALAIRDLESPGGTFVNRRRVLPGQATALQAGDLIQLGGVQLRVVARAAAGPKVPGRSGPFSYALAGGTTCRTWDDFLTASSQRWEPLRDELTSGRLGTFLRSIGRSDLVPAAGAAGSPDDRLDAWLGSLPTTRPAGPELDVHPPRLVIRATPGGGTIRKSVRVANVGYRLLRATARVEPAGLAWLSLAPPFAGKPFATSEGIDVLVDLAVPETLPDRLRAELVIEGNGGSKRVAVVLEAKPSAVEAPEAGPMASGATLAELIGRQTPLARVATWGMAALALRLVIGVAGGSIGEDAMAASGPDAPRLAGVALVLAAAGMVVGGALAARRGGRGEVPAGGFAGASGGVIVAAALVATCRSVEPGLGSWSTSILGVSGLWALLGGGLAALSAFFIQGKP